MMILWHTGSRESFRVKTIQAALAAVLWLWWLVSVAQQLGFYWWPLWQRSASSVGGIDASSSAGRTITKICWLTIPTYAICVMKMKSSWIWLKQRPRRNLQIFSSCDRILFSFYSRILFWFLYSFSVFSPNHDSIFLINYEFENILPRRL